MMKMTQAWGWLAAGVLAAGLNASYHQGGLEWAHQIADRFEHSSAAVLDLASGHADQFVSEARLLTDRDEASSCRLGTTLARVQSKIARSQRQFDNFEAMSAREEAQLVRFDANRNRMEVQIEAQTSHLRIATAALAPVAFRAMPAPPVCPRIRVSIPRLPRLQIPAVPVIHIETASAGPV
jgi:hypothetical protein